MLLTMAIALLVGAMVLFFLELFVPSMGFLTVAGLACAAGSCWVAFGVSPNTGWLFVGLNAVGAVAAVAAAFKVLPHSPLTLKRSEIEDGGYQPVEKPGELLGKVGVAFTTLRPGGTALIEGRKIDVVASGGFIEPNARVKVIAVEGFRVVVERETF